MDSVTSELQAWALGGYDRVISEAARRGVTYSKDQARRLINAQIRRYYKQTDRPIWRPLGHAGRERLRRAIMDNKALDNRIV